jgi:diguanylate cyclase (GGDEF)-like protein
VGVMRFEVELEGSHDERELRIDEFESVLSDIAKHLALVVKTPRLHDRAVIDGLTGLFTRRHFDIRADDMFRLARRYGTPFSLILVDIDHFKDVNDTHGHGVGDAVLRETAGLVTGGIRDCDSAFRYGGEEFAVLLPETPVEHASVIAERLRKAIREHTVQTEQAAGLTVTASMGVAEYGPTLANYGELVGLADKALYAAKRAGRDRTVTSEEMTGGAGS